MSDTPEQANTGASVESPAPSASETVNQQENAGAQVEGSEKQQAQPQVDGSTKAGKREMFGRRQAAKQQAVTVSLEDQIKSLTEAVGKLTAQPQAQEAEVEPEPVVKPQSKPNQHSVAEEVRSQLGQVLDDQRYDAEGREAENWLLTRSHIKSDPNATAEIEAILKGDLAHVASQTPKVAAEAAYMRWCSSKGVAPDLESVNYNASVSAARAGGISPSGSTTGSVRRSVSRDAIVSGKPSIAEANAFLKTLKKGSQEWFDAGQAIEDGIAEGRINK